MSARLAVVLLVLAVLAPAADAKTPANRCVQRLYALGGFASATVDEAAALPAKVLTTR